MNCTVVKVGGSLYDLPDLRQRLESWLSKLNVARVMLIPGGGATADVVRDYDRLHALGEEASHWLAIEALSLNARFLHTLLPHAIVCSEQASVGSGIQILDPLPFFRADESKPDHLPHRWSVTSDSLAVRAAVLFGASDLILLKSLTWTAGDWENAMRERVVDGYFTHALQQAKDLRVSIVNFRAQ